MAGTQIGKLAIVLQADAQQAFAEFDKVEARAKRLKSSTEHGEAGGGLLGKLTGIVGSDGSMAIGGNLAEIASGINPVVAGFVAAAEAGHKLLDTVIDIANEQKKLANEAANLGMSAAGLAGLKTISGGSESLDRGLARMVRTIGEAAEGSQEAQKTFDRLGVSWQGLAAMTGEDQFAAIAGGINKLPTAAAKADAAFKVFGKGTQDLLTVIRRGPEAINEFIDAAHKRGIGDKELADASREWNRAKAEMQEAWEGLKIQFAKFFLPIVKVLADWIKQLTHIIDEIAGGKSNEQVQAERDKERSAAFAAAQEQKAAKAADERQKAAEATAKAAKDFADALKKADDALAGKLLDQTRTSAEKFEREVADAQHLLVAGKITQDVFARSKLKAIEELESAFKDEAKPLAALTRGSQADRSFQLQMDRDRASAEKPINQRIAEALQKAELKDQERNKLLQQIRDGIKENSIEEIPL